MKNRRPQCKDIPDRAVLELLAKNLCKSHFVTSDPGEKLSIMPAFRFMDGGYADRNLVLAKMRRLIGRGFVEGCACGCRRYFEISKKGLEWLRARNSFDETCKDLARLGFFDEQKVTSLTYRDEPFFTSVKPERAYSSPTLGVYQDATQLQTGLRSRK